MAEPNSTNAAPRKIYIGNITQFKQWQCQCGHPYFTWVYEVRIIPRMMTATSKDIEQSIAHRKCDSCGHITLDKLVADKPS